MAEELFPEAVHGAAFGGEDNEDSASGKWHRNQRQAGDAKSNHPPLDPSAIIAKFPPGQSPYEVPE